MPLNVYISTDNEACFLKSLGPHRITVSGQSPQEVAVPEVIGITQSMVIGEVRTYGLSNLVDLPWSEEIINLLRGQIDSIGIVEMIKNRIKDHIDQTDELPDQAMIAKELQVEIERVDQAYEKLVEEGVVHRETFHLFKNPATRKRLLEAMETKEEISLEEVHERLGVEERSSIETASA